MLHNSHKQVPFLNICYSSTIQMVWVIFIHVIIEVTDISLTSKACLSRQVHFHHFSFCNCINFDSSSAATLNVISNSVHLSEQLANVFNIRRALENKKKIVPKCERAYGVCKLKDTTTDHCILCVVTFCFMGTLE